MRGQLLGSISFKLQLHTWFENLLFFLLKEEVELVLEHFVADSLFLETVKYLITSLSWNSWTSLNKHPILAPDLVVLLRDNHPKTSNQ